MRDAQPVKREITLIILFFFFSRGEESFLKTPTAYLWLEVDPKSDLKKLLTSKENGDIFTDFFRLFFFFL